MSEKDSGENKRGGCAPLGCLIIIIAIAAVLFYFLVKPVLEERGFSVEAMQAKILVSKEKVRDNISAAEVRLNSASDQAIELREQTTDHLYELKQDVKEKLPKTPIKLYEE